MKSAYAGTDASLTYGVTTGGTFTAKVVDPQGRYIKATASESAGIATVTITAGAWLDGATGIGKVQVIRNDAGAKTIEASENFRILPGLEAAETYRTDYR